MNTRELKKILKDNLEMETDLYDFCIDCLKKIYGDDSDIAISQFETNYEYSNDNGWSDLSCVDRDVKDRLDHRKEYKRKLALENLHEIPMEDE